MAVMKATKPPTEPPRWPLCHSATTMTADNAQAAIICVSGVIVAAATAAFTDRRRSVCADARETRGPRWPARAVQAHDAPGEYVLFHHVGELVGGALAFHGQPVQPPAQRAHDQATAGNSTPTNSVSRQFSHIR
jgi:hypothetical protein